MTKYPADLVLGDRKVFHNSPCREQIILSNLNNVFSSHMLCSSMVTETLWVAPRQVYIALQEAQLLRQWVGLLTDFFEQGIEFNIGIALPSL